MDAPPEVTSTLIYTGPGAGPLLEAAGAWRALAAELAAAETGWRNTIAALSDMWRGPSAQAMAVEAANYADWLAKAAAHTARVASAANFAAQSYSAVRAAVVHPAAVAANRAQLAVLVATNLLGQNTAAIAANEAHYAAMWAQDTAAMTAYAASSAHAMAMEAPPVPTGAPTALTSQPVAVGGSTVGQILGALLGQPESGGIAGWLSGVTSSGQGLGLNANFWNTVMSSGAFNPLQIAQLAASFGTLGAVEQVATATAHAAAGIEAPVIPAAPPVARGPEAPRAAAGGAGTTIRGLSVPPSWAQQTGTAARIGVTVTEAAPMTEGVMPVPPAVPVAGRGPRRARKPDPEYGDVPKVMPRPPAGG
nr:PPE family protein [Mycobacterium eburneum]